MQTKLIKTKNIAEGQGLELQNFKTSTNEQ